MTKPNLVLRFFLELAALTGIALVGWSIGETWSAWLLAVLLPTLAMSIWGVFAMKGDPSRSGKTIVDVPGFIRLLIESLVFVTGFFGLLTLHNPILSWIYLGLVLLHYGFSWKRLKWMFKR